MPVEADLARKLDAAEHEPPPRREAMDVVAASDPVVHRPSAAPPARRIEIVARRDFHIRDVAGDDFDLVPGRLERRRLVGRVERGIRGALERGEQPVAPRPLRGLRQPQQAAVESRVDPRVARLQSHALDRIGDREPRNGRSRTSRRLDDRVNQRTRDERARRVVYEDKRRIRGRQQAATNRVGAARTPGDHSANTVPRGDFRSARAGRLVRLQYDHDLSHRTMIGKRAHRAREQASTAQIQELLGHASADTPGATGRDDHRNEIPRFGNHARRGSDLHQFFFFGLADFVDLVDMTIGELLDLVE